MILNCNSCGKKFVVPDQAITSEGRLVQCGSCGNKWKQFPNVSKKTSINIKQSKPKKITKVIKNKTRGERKPRDISLYSPEYLAKKHGIKLDGNINETHKNKNKNKTKDSLGFYNLIIVFLVFFIALSRGLYFFQDFIIQKIPFTEFYINYFFESMRNVFEIWKNLISSY